MLFSQVHMDQVEVTIPNGETARFPVEEIRFKKKDGSLLSVSCGIKKDSGDDPDITDGVLVKSRVERIRQGVCLVEGGEGVGRVTGPGLDQPVGAAAINRVPREMIRREPMSNLPGKITDPHLSAEEPLTFRRCLRFILQALLLAFGCAAIIRIIGILSLFF